MKSGEIDFLIGTAGIGLTLASEAPVTVASASNVCSIRFGRSDGATACLKAYADTIFEVCLRISPRFGLHAETPIIVAFLPLFIFSPVSAGLVNVPKQSGLRQNIGAVRPSIPSHDSILG